MVVERLGAVPSYYLRYFYLHDDVLAEQRAGKPRAAEVAEIERELQDTDYGSREYSARDPEGNRWSFGTYCPTR